MTHWLSTPLNYMNYKQLRLRDCGSSVYRLCTLSSDTQNFPSWQKKLGLFFYDGGLWRCGGWLNHADLPYSTKHLILLLRNHHLTTLIIQDAHENVSDNKVKKTLTEVRRRFWIAKKAKSCSIPYTSLCFALVTWGCSISGSMCPSWTSILSGNLRSLILK